MLIDCLQYNWMIWAWIGIALITFILLLYVRAPYGRYERPGWGFRLPSRLGWMIMESPCIIIMTTFFVNTVSGYSTLNVVPIIFYCIWMFHYLNRTLVWPIRAHLTNKKMPISIVLFAIMFNSINSGINAHWIFGQHSLYNSDWLMRPQFIIGLLIFFTGMIINVYSDNILFLLRKDGNTKYKIPYGGLFKWVSSPNYFGEILEWIGWALATWSLAGLSFAIWAIANLAPRSYSNHLWYKEKFPDYPKDRKILIPKIW